MSLELVLLIGAGALIVVACLVSAGRLTPRFTHRRLARRSRRARAWLTDVILGWLIGSAVVAILGESLLATTGAGSTTLTRTTFAMTGAILGIAFMRLVRSREQTPPRESEDTSEGPGGAA